MFPCYVERFLFSFHNPATVRIKHTEGEIGLLRANFYEQ